jgi:hypothetical protein
MESANAMDLTPVIELGPQARVLPGFAGSAAHQLFEDTLAIAQQSPFRHQVTPGGFQMSVAATNCGRIGWVSDRRGYRYDPIDPVTGQPWPVMPPSYDEIAVVAAKHAGFEGPICTGRQAFVAPRPKRKEHRPPSGDGVIGPAGYIPMGRHTAYRQASRGAANPRRCSCFRRREPIVLSWRQRIARRRPSDGTRVPVQSHVPHSTVTSADRASLQRRTGRENARG